MLNLGFFSLAFLSESCNCANIFSRHFAIDFHAQPLLDIIFQKTIMKILSFTHPGLVPNQFEFIFFYLLNMWYVKNMIYWRKLETDHHWLPQCLFLPCMSVVTFPTFFKITFLLNSNKSRVRKWCQNCNFWMNYSFYE